MNTILEIKPNSSTVPQHRSCTSQQTISHLPRTVPQHHASTKATIFANKPPTTHALQNNRNSTTIPTILLSERNHAPPHPPSHLLQLLPPGPPLHLHPLSHVPLPRKNHPRNRQPRSRFLPTIQAQLQHLARRSEVPTSGTWDGG
jgi:hypothetical protein